MSCVDFRDRVEELLDGTLPPEQADRLRAHPEGCAACAAELETASRFRALLAEEGHLALDALETRRITREVLTRPALTEQSPTADRPPPAADVRRPAAPARPAGRRNGPAQSIAATPAPAGSSLRAIRFALVGGAMAAGVVLALGVTFWPASTPALAEGVSTTVVRGTLAQISDRASVRGLRDLHVTLVAGAPDETVLLERGSGLFTAADGVDLTVESDRGTAAGRGSTFVMALDREGGFAVTVLRGDVRVRGTEGGDPRELRAGERIEMDRRGAAHMITRAAIEELEIESGMRGMEVALLDGESTRLREELAELRRQRTAAGPSPAVPAASPETLDGLPWDQLGAAARELLRGQDWGREKTPKQYEAMGVLLLHTEQLQEATGAENPLDSLLHPAVIRRLATPLLSALAPDATASSVSAAAADVNAAAELSLARTHGDLLPAEAIADRLTLVRSLILAAREHLGDEAAAEVAGGFRGAQDLTPIFSWRLTDELPTDSAARWSKHFDLTADQRDRVPAVVEDYVAATLAVQAALEQQHGVETATRILHPRRRWGSQPPREGPAPAKAPPSERVDAALLAIEVKLALAGPRAEYERRLMDLLRPDQRERGFTNRWGLFSYRIESE